MDPTVEEIGSICPVGAALKWAVISGSPSDPGSDAETLLTHLSIAADSLPRLVPVFTDAGGYLGGYHLATCKKLVCALVFVGATPSSAEECAAKAAEQFSAVAALLRDGDPPFVYFSVFTPFNRRLQRKLAATGLQLTWEGTFRRVRLMCSPGWQLSSCFALRWYP
eukprot:3445286-Amphidinium_carterae.1